MNVLIGTMAFAALSLLLGSVCWLLMKRYGEVATDETTAEHSGYLIRFLRNGVYSFAVIASVLVAAGVLELTVG